MSLSCNFNNPLDYLLLPLDVDGEDGFDGLIPLKMSSRSVLKSVQNSYKISKKKTVH